MKKVAVFHTGGTISMKKAADGGLDIRGANALGDVAAIIDAFTEANQVELIQEQIFEVSSPQITEEHMLELRQGILKKLDEIKDIDGVVVTHGTDTLEETAYFLDITLPNTIPIVLVGALRSLNEIGTDALKNFQSAIKVAMSDEAKGMGAMIVMNEEIHAARNVTKTHTTNLAAFQSPDAGRLGLLTAAENVVFNRRLPDSPHYEINGITKKVMLVKAFAGIDSLIFDALDALEEKQGKFPIDGLVIEALGAGNMPARVVASLQKIEQKGIPIVITSRCLAGLAQPVYAYSGGGKSLKTTELKSVIFSNGLNGQKARLKLTVLLENTNDITAIEAEFNKH